MIRDDDDGAIEMDDDGAIEMDLIDIKWQEKIPKSLIGVDYRGGLNNIKSIYCLVLL